MARALSVGTRWSFLYTGVTLVALSIPIGFIYLSVERQIERDARILLDSYLAEVRSEVDAHHERPDVAVRAFTDRLRRLSPELHYGARLVRRDGSVAFRIGSMELVSPEDPTAEGAAPAEPDLPDLVAGVPYRGGRLEAAISSRSFSGSVERIRRLMLFAAPLALAVSALCGAWLARRSLRPIAQMTESAQRIGAKNLSERIAIRGTNDELDQLAATLNGMFDRIGYAMERLRGFSADAAHQLKSPIASLQNEIEVTLEQARLDAGTRHLLEGILAQVVELGGCVGAMLRLARSESGFSEGQAVPVDLVRLLEGVLALFEPMAEERGIALDLQAPDGLEVHGDTAWLRELFANLVRNALENTPAGGRVSILATTGPDEVAIQVMDDGEGISAADQKRIFDRFYRISPDRGVPGAGLGLALAQQIAVAHGGSIELESELGRGSTFTVHLPRPESPAAGAPGGSAPRARGRLRARSVPGSPGRSARAV